MRYFVTVGKGERAMRRQLRFEERPDGTLLAHMSGVEDEDHEHARKTFVVDGRSLGNGSALHLIVGAESHDFGFEDGIEGRELVWRGQRLPIDVVDELELLARQVAGSGDSGAKEVRASMPGIVVSVEVGVGDAIEAGQTLVILEAMKMQNPIAAEGSGSIKAVHVEAGQAVAAGEVLLSIE